MCCQALGLSGAKAPIPKGWGSWKFLRPLWADTWQGAWSAGRWPSEQRAECLPRLSCCWSSLVRRSSQITICSLGRPGSRKPRGQRSHRVCPATQRGAGGLCLEQTDAVPSRVTLGGKAGYCAVAAASQNAPPPSRPPSFLLKWPRMPQPYVSLAHVLDSVLLACPSSSTPSPLLLLKQRGDRYCTQKENKVFRKGSKRYKQKLGPVGGGEGAKSACHLSPRMTTTGRRCDWPQQAQVQIEVEPDGRRCQGPASPV